jgi:Flp pilus assembly protein TadB
MHADGTGRNAFKENALCAIIEEACMPLSPEQEALCERLEKGESTPNAAALIRQQAHEIDDLWDRLLSRAYSFAESPGEMIQEEMEQLRAMLDARQHSQLKKTG